MKILAIETSCDETAAAVTEERRVLASKIYSQVQIHKKWGGVVPSLAKRAHMERIQPIIKAAITQARLSEADLDAIAVTFGPGLAPALEVGILEAKSMSARLGVPLIPVNHMEGHIYSCFVENSKGMPKRDFQFPLLALLVSGGHTEIVLFSDHVRYEVLGATLDDAAGEALDKAAKMLGLGYPGGAVIERLAEQGDPAYHRFPRPMAHQEGYNFSFSGLKTSLYYFLQKMSEKTRIANMENIAASYQEAVIDTLILKLTYAIRKTSISHVLVGGGVSANRYFRKRVRECVKKHGGHALFPSYKYLYGDNAAMIGVAAHFRAQKKMYLTLASTLERTPRSSLDDVSYTPLKSIPTK